ncbi:MAG: winged helix-turn-helix transcriptional regulator [Alphaproteobacteria bacterium]|nr:winged helix-turn-helix transcriptional regulator [Alphaproteobacteria bacterium]
MYGIGHWTFLTNHAHVLLCIARDPDLRLREIAELVGITERAAQRIVRELADEGYVEITRTGRRNHYTVLADQPLRHPVEAGTSVHDLILLAVGVKV